MFRFVRPENEVKFGNSPWTIKLFPIYSNFSIPVKEERFANLVERLIPISKLPPIDFRFPNPSNEVNACKAA